MAVAAALSLYTMFATIPLLALGLLVAKSAGMLEAGKETLREVLEQSGLDRMEIRVEQSEKIRLGEEILKRVYQVESKLTIGRLGPVGGIALLLATLNLLASVERAMNRIFGSQRRRPLRRRLTLYWSAVTAGPLILLGASYAARTAAAHIAEMATLSGETRPSGATQATLWGIALPAVIWASPILGSGLVLVAVYKLVPTRPVPFRAALAGAAIALPLWLTAKWAFTLYVVQLVAKGSVYGALGLLPLFCILLELFWLIFLFGASVAYGMSNLDRIRAAGRVGAATLGPSDVLAAAVAVANPYLAGRGPVSFDQIRDHLRLPDESIRWLLDQLIAIGVLCRVSQPSQSTRAYVFAKPPHDIPVHEILSINGSDADLASSGRYTSEVLAPVVHVQQQTRDALGDLSLWDVVTMADAPPRIAENPRSALPHGGGRDGSGQEAVNGT